MHASADWRNVERTILHHVAKADVGGALVLPADANREPAADTRAWVRVGVTATGSRWNGRVGGLPATRESLMVSAEVFTRLVNPDGSESVDSAAGLAAKVANALRYRDLPLVDAVADPTGQTLVAGVAVRFDRPPVVRHLSAADGYARRVVDVDGHYFSRQEA